MQLLEPLRHAVEGFRQLRHLVVALDFDAAVVVAGGDGLHAGGERAQRPRQPARDGVTDQQRQPGAGEEDDDEDIAARDPVGGPVVAPEAAEHHALQLADIAAQGAVDAGEGAAGRLAVEYLRIRLAQLGHDARLQHQVAVAGALGAIQLVEAVRPSAVKPEVEGGEGTETAEEIVIQPGAKQQLVLAATALERLDRSHHGADAFFRRHPVQRDGGAQPDALAAAQRQGAVNEIAAIVDDRQGAEAFAGDDVADQRRHIALFVDQAQQQLRLLRQHPGDIARFMLRIGDAAEKIDRGLVEPALEVALEGARHHLAGQLGGEKHRHQADDQERQQQPRLQRAAAPHHDGRLLPLRNFSSGHHLELIHG